MVDYLRLLKVHILLPYGGTGCCPVEDLDSPLQRTQALIWGGPEHPRLTDDDMMVTAGGSKSLQVFSLSGLHGPTSSLPQHPQILNLPQSCTPRIPTLLQPDTPLKKKKIPTSGYPFTPASQSFCKSRILAPLYKSRVPESLLSPSLIPAGPPYLVIRPQMLDCKGTKQVFK